MLNSNPAPMNKMWYRSNLEVRISALDWVMRVVTLSVAIHAV